MDAELMVLGFISLLLTFGQNYFSRICISLKYANTMLPCELRPLHATIGGEEEAVEPEGHRRRLLWQSQQRRFLSSEPAGPGCHEGMVPLISVNGLHQLHIFIFFLAVFHVFYSAITMTLGRLKIRAWKVWEQDHLKEQEAMTGTYIYIKSHPSSFVFISFCFSIFAISFIHWKLKIGCLLVQILKDSDSLMRYPL